MSVPVKIPAILANIPLFCEMTSAEIELVLIQKHNDLILLDKT
jgi:hypothetical protein